MVKTGKAYGFLKCNKPLAQVEKTMSAIRRDIKTPSELELKIAKEVTHIGDALLHETVTPDIIDEGQCNYAFQATLDEADNETAAKELKAILTQSYNTPLFMPRPKEFYGIVFYERNGQYEEF